MVCVSWKGALKKRRKINGHKTRAGCTCCAVTLAKYWMKRSVVNVAYIHLVILWIRFLYSVLNFLLACIRCSKASQPAMLLLITQRMSYVIYN
jgi:hypothetical protein